MDGNTSDKIACLHNLREKKWSNSYRNRHIHQNVIFCIGRPRQLVVFTVVSKDHSACMFKVKKSKHSNPEDRGIAILRDIGDELPIHTS